MDRISSELKEFLNNKYIQQAINNNDWEEVYENANNYSNLVTSELTQLLISTGIDPLAYMGYVPEYYLYGSKITNFKISDNIKTIKFNAFAYCNNLKSMVFPTNLEVIDNGAFYSCESLDNIFIPNSVISIGKSTFGYCDSLKTLSIGNGVRYINARAFIECPVTEIEYRGTVNEWQQVDIEDNTILYKVIIHCIDGNLRWDRKLKIWAEV